ncbi:non-homologous end joining protein Ku [Haloplasma contractile]|uniref:Non-homologous end joining protein Ku n=1 Tax=Haloplasma contractile SSD-17B TaxID=1033810 RepID=F7Q1G4_9MOLU|nr:Ku protein [Haloplasma contractile]ERJ12883.1 Ku70/Ku80 beta-barrel domain protein [Haloplasma contractile SSD-17B]
MGVSWKGSISFGLIYIPISLKVAAKEERIGFNMLHKDDHHRIKYKKFCEYCGEEVKHADIIKGYQYEDNKYITFDDDDFEKIKSNRDKTIQIMQFVDASEIDSIYYDKSYYVVPEGGEKAFEVLRRALSESNKVGIAKAVLGTDESLIALRMSHNNMVLNKLFFRNEIRPAEVKEIHAEVNQSEVDLAKQLILNMSNEFEPDQFHNEYNEKLKAAIEMKIEGKEIEVPKEEEGVNVVNLMEALQQSVKATERPRV